MGLSSAAMRYLLVIYELSDGGKPVRSVDIARALEVSPASVVHMMGVLAGEGLVLKRHYGQVQLTAEGIRASNQLYTKCTILESFLLQELDVSRETARQDAVACLCSLSEESIERVSHEAFQCAGHVDSGAFQFFTYRCIQCKFLLLFVF